MEKYLSTAEELVNTITQLKERAEAAARATEEASNKANSESAFAFNAKKNAEEHASAISQIHGTVDAEIAGLTTTKKNAEETASAITVLKATADSDARTISERKAVIENEAAAAKATSEKGAASLVEIEKIQANVTAALKDVTSSTEAVVLAKTSADAAAAAITILHTESEQLASKATKDGAAIAKIESDSQSNYISLSKAVTTAEEAQKNVAEYEKRLSKLTEEFAALNKKIEGLLPNATSAGLASAFRNQKERFKKPQRHWLRTFVITIVLLLIVGLVGSPILGVNVTNPTNSTFDTWDAILRHITGRLPLIIPLVWLGIYSGRNYMLALRVEEEYAFKEAVSTAFEGYKREMANIPAIGSNETPPLVVLCENVLRALAQRPGRIYEGRHEDITPFTSVKGIFDIRKPGNTTRIAEEPAERP